MMPLRSPVARAETFNGTPTDNPTVDRVDKVVCTQQDEVEVVGYKDLRVHKA